MENSTHFNSMNGNLSAVIFTNATKHNNTNNNSMIASSDNGTSAPHIQPNLFYRSQATIIVQVTLLAILGTIIIIGNLASIITFLKTQSLRRKCHYFVISLSFADLLVGVNDLMALYFFLTGPQFSTFAVALEFVDTFTGTASILTLSAISYERFFAIYFPFRHRMVSFKCYLAFLVFPWIVAAALSALWPISLFTGDMTVTDIYQYKVFFIGSLALAIILTSYASIGLKIRQNNPSAQNQNRSSRERKLAITLLIVTIASLLTWLPLQCFLIVLYLCKTCPRPHLNVLFAMKFLQYMNSGLNVFIYIIRMPEFRKAFVSLICNNGDTVDQDSTATNQSTIGNPSVRSNYQKSVSLSKNVSKPYDNPGFTLNSKSNLKNDRNVLQNRNNLAEGTRNKTGKDKNVEFENIRELGEVQNDGATNNGFSKDYVDTKL